MKVASQNGKNCTGISNKKHTKATKDTSGQHDSDDSDEKDEFMERIQKWDLTSKSNWKFRPSHRNVTVSAVKTHQNLELKLFQDSKVIEDVESDLAAWSLSAHAEDMEENSMIVQSMIDVNSLLAMKAQRKALREAKFATCESESAGKGNVEFDTISLQTSTAIVCNKVEHVPSICKDLQEAHSNSEAVLKGNDFMTEQLEVLEMEPNNMPQLDLEMLLTPTRSKFIPSKGILSLRGGETIGPTAGNLTLSKAGKFDILRRHNSSRGRNKNKFLESSTAGCERESAIAINNQTASTSSLPFAVMSERARDDNIIMGESNGCTPGIDSIAATVTATSTSKNTVISPIDMRTYTHFHTDTSTLVPSTVQSIQLSPRGMVVANSSAASPSRSSQLQNRLGSESMQVPHLGLSMKSLLSPNRIQTLESSEKSSDRNFLLAQRVNTSDGKGQENGTCMSPRKNLFPGNTLQVIATSTSAFLRDETTPAATATNAANDTTTATAATTVTTVTAGTAANVTAYDYTEQRRELASLIRPLNREDSESDHEAAILGPSLRSDGQLLTKLRLPIPVPSYMKPVRKVALLLHIPLLISFPTLVIILNLSTS